MKNGKNHKKLAIINNHKKLAIIITVTIIIAICTANVPLISPASGAQEPKVIFSEPGGFYEQNFMLTLSIAPEGWDIYYTLDGTDPDPARVTPGITGAGTKKYISSIQIYDATPNPNIYSMKENVDGAWWNGVYKQPNGNVPKCVMVKAAAVNFEGEKTSIETNSYFVETNFKDKYKLPVISLVTDPENLFSEDTGIYVRGQNRPRSNVSGDKDAYNMFQSGSEWERPAHLEIYNADGTVAVSQNIGIRIHGSASKIYPQKTIRVYAKKEYDADNPSISYDLFPGLKNSNGKPITDFKRILLRNSGNDWEVSMFKDITVHRYLEGMPFPKMAGTAAVMYLDGEFWGVTNIRERFDDEYIASHYNVNKNDVVMLEVVWDRVEIDEGEPGDELDYKELRNFILDYDMKDSGNYEYVKTKFDMDNYMSYYIAQLFVANMDWPGNNKRIWRSKGTPSGEYGNDGKWRWMFYDADCSMGLWSSNNAALDTLDRLLKDDDRTSKMFAKLYQNQEFKKEFTQKYIDYLNTNFISKRLIDITTKGKNDISTAMAFHNYRFNYIENTIWGDPPTRTWTANANAFINYASKRTGEVRRQLVATFNLKNQFNVQIIDPISEGGTVKIGNRVLDASMLGESGNWNGIYYDTVKPTLQAIPNDGKVFAKWEIKRNGITSYHENDTVEMAAGADVTVKAIYEDVKEVESDLVIGFVYFGTDNTVPVSNSFVELYNPNDFDIILTNHYSLQYKSMDEELTPDWQKLDLKGTVPAKTSFLVNCGPTGARDNLRMKLENFDQLFSGIKPYNKGIKVVIMKSAEKLPAMLKDPFTGDGKGQVEGYVDMYGVSGNDDTRPTADGYETECVPAGSPDGQSKQKGFMRVSSSGKRYADTDHNLRDFIQVDFRSSELSIKPRSLADGNWEPVAPSPGPASPTRSPTRPPTKTPPGFPAETPAVTTPAAAITGTPIPTGTPAPTQEIYFRDVEDGFWAKDIIYEAADKGLFNGVGEGLFDPGGKFTRGMFVMVLARLDGVYLTDGDTKFVDVSPGDYFAKAVKWTSDNGIVNGTSADIFEPDTPISRQDAATVLGRYFDKKAIDPPAVKPGVVFDDNSDIVDYAHVWVYKMQLAGILNGKDNHKFEPRELTTRTEAAAIFVRICDKVKIK